MYRAIRAIQPTVVRGRSSKSLAFIVDLSAGRLLDRLFARPMIAFVRECYGIRWNGVGWDGIKWDGMGRGGAGEGWLRLRKPKGDQGGIVLLGAVY